MATIYADGTLSSNCLGTYNPLTRACGTGAGTAYTTIQAAANVLAPGDILEIRAGTYNASLDLNTVANGTSTNLITIRGYQNIERPVFKKITGLNKKYFTFSHFNLDLPADQSGAFHISCSSLVTDSIHHITIDDVRMTNCTGSVINFTPNAVTAVEGIVHDITINNCYLQTDGSVVGDDNISFNNGGYNFTITNNTVVGSNEQCIDIKWLFHDIVIKYNTFSDAQSGGIEINAFSGGAPTPNACYNIEIAYNTFRHCGIAGGTQNGGISNTQGSATSGFYKIHHNLIDCSTTTARDCILVRDFNIPVQVYNNTCIGATNGIATQSGVTATIKNNTCSGQTGNAFNATGAPTEDYNNWFPTISTIIHYNGNNYTSLATYRTATGQGAHSLSVPPSFANTTTYDLLPNSLLIDAGVAIPGITDGYFGTAPDMGWSEFVINIFNVASNFIGDSTFSLSWTTSSSTNTQTTFGTTTAYNGFSGKNTTLVTSHVDSLFNLIPNTLYHFRALSSGGASTDQTIITNLPQPTNMRRKTTYYVSTTGSDTNPGTISQPFRTIVKGLSVMGASDTLYIRGGTYSEGIDYSHGTIPTGTSWSNAPLISAYGSEVVTLSHIGLNAGYIKYVIFQNFVVDAAGFNEGISMGPSTSPQANHCRFINIEVKNSLRQGILLPHQGNSFNEFYGCHVHNTGTILDNIGNHGFYISGQNNLIDGCEVDHVPQYGIHVFNGNAGEIANNNTIRNCRIHNNSLQAGNKYGIIISSGGSNLVYNNLIYNDSGGIYAYNGANNSLIFNNTIYNNGPAQPGIQVDLGVTGIQIKNNIVYLNSAGNIGNGDPSTILANNLTINPLFVNAAGADFHLQAGSPAIDAGLNLSTYFTTDYDGVARPAVGPWEIGAFEKV